VLKRMGIDGSLGDGGVGAFGPMHLEAAPCVRDLMTLQATPDLPEKISTLVLHTYKGRYGKILRVNTKEDDNGCPLPLGESGAESGEDA
jgi:hypothetical protein